MTTNARLALLALTAAFALSACSTDPVAVDTVATVAKPDKERDATSRMATGSGFKDPRANYTPKGVTFKRRAN